jgi:hypothetical protein
MFKTLLKTCVKLKVINMGVFPAPPSLLMLLLVAQILQIFLSASLFVVVQPPSLSTCRLGDIPAEAPLQSV